MKAGFMRNWILLFPDKNLGTRFDVKDAAHPDGHHGVDYNKLKVGTKLKCVADGSTFIQSYWSDALGWVTEYQVGKWFISYCHTKDKVTTKAGSKLASGDTVALLGNTGSATSGPHCHVTLSTKKGGAVTGPYFDFDAFIKQQIKEDK
jgi:murein DD-endopeptidase MepM/ murein hydrolase activator NlpD